MILIYVFKLTTLLRAACRDSNIGFVAGIFEQKQYLMFVINAKHVSALPERRAGS